MNITVETPYGPQVITRWDQGQFRWHPRGAPSLTTQAFRGSLGPVFLTKCPEGGTYFPDEFFAWRDGQFEPPAPPLKVGDLVHSKQVNTLAFARGAFLNRVDWPATIIHIEDDVAVLKAGDSLCFSHVGDLRRVE